MPSYRNATVLEVFESRPGLQRVSVRLADEESPGRAYVLTQLIGDVAVGDQVILNTTAVELGLGTGGWHVVHWNLARSELHVPGPGHIMKLRYTTTQIDTGAAEEMGSRSARPANRRPVVVCQLHSQVAVVAATVRRQQPGARITYIMTDGAALPLAISDLVHQMKSGGVVDRTITAGQAFGGDLEAINVASGIDVAFGDGADVVIVGQGPGVVGTNSGLGFSGLDAVHHLADAKLAGATPVFCLRWSDTDQRPRHRGLSHHSSAVLDRSPEDLIYAMPRSHGDVAIFAGDARVVDVPDVYELLTELNLDVRTMGRSVVDDRSFFSFAAAAGVVAAKLLAPAPQ